MNVASLLFRGRRRAARPLAGYLEEPARDLVLGREIAVGGWLVDPAGEGIARITASVDGGSERELRRPIARPDVERRFAGNESARAAGFRGEVWIDDSMARLEVWAYSPAGLRRRAFAVNLRRTLPPPLGSEPPRDARKRRAPRIGLGERLLARGLEPRFVAMLVAAAGDEFPRAGAAAPGLFRELQRAWPLLDRRWAALANALRGSFAPTAPAPVARADRILFVSGMFPSVFHGGGLRLFDIIQALSTGREIDLYSPFRADLDGSSWEALRPSLHAARLVRSPELRAEDVERWLARLGRKRGDYDVAHFEFPGSVPTLSAVKGWAKRSFFTMIEGHTRASMIDLERALAEGGDAATAVSRLASSLASERSALLQCHRAIAVTDPDAAFAQRCFGGPRPLVIPTCLSPQIPLDLDITSRPPVALFLGYFEHPPNMEGLRWYLEEVHPLIASRVPGYRVRVVGYGDLAEVRARWQHDPAVELIGAVPSLAEPLSRARIGLAPLHIGAGIRGKINQYAAAGLPTVSTRAAAAGLPYRDGDSIALAESPEEFARAAEQLLTDDDLWRRMSAHGRALAVEHFSWPATLARLQAAHVA